MRLRDAEEISATLELGETIDDIDDIEERLAVLSRASGPMRRAATSVAARMIACQGWERLGYARVGDYARERLGQSGRTLTEWARVERTLCELPRLEGALVAGTLPWSKVRLLARFVSAGDEAVWILRAARMSVRALEHAVRAVDRSAAALSDVGGAVASDEAETDEEGLSTEPLEWVRVRGSSRMAFAWSHARRMASKVAGERVSQAVALELITAEVLSALPVVRESEPEDEGSRLSRSCSPLSVKMAAVTAQEMAQEIADGVAASERGESLEHDIAAPVLEDQPPRSELPAFVQSLVADLDDADPFELDARLRRVVRLEQRLDSEIAPLLRRVVDNRSARGSRVGGDRTLASYARDRLGMSPRKARALVRLEKLGDHCAELRGAFREGEISWVQAQVLAPLLVADFKDSPSPLADRAADRADAVRGDWRTNWLAFAQRVTVRRLEDVVKHALVSGEFDAEAANRNFGRVGDDRIGGADRNDAVDHTDTQPGDSARQTCARPTQLTHPSQPNMRVQVGIHAPHDIASLFHATLNAVRKLLEQPLGRLPDAGEAFEAMIEHALSTWEAQDPSIRRSRPNQRVFERDGWQCTVPGCSTQRNLQAHHIVFRSAGGGDDLENQTTLCAFHHHRGVHARRVGVRGSAPQRLRFELGLRRGKAPLVSYASGDRVVAHA